MFARLADVGVAEVAEVVLLDARTQARVLDFGEVAELGAVADRAARPEVGERPDLHVVLDLGRLEHARPDAAVAPDRAVDQLGAGADPGPLAHPAAAAQDDVRLEDHVGPSSTVGST